ncbi:MAG: DNA recombination protein RmuC, partial [candidate division WOR-3 bacterium]
MFYLGFFILGLIIGGLIVYFIFYFKKQDAHKIAQQIIAQAEEKKNQELELIINRIKESFGSLSLEALSRNTDQFLKLANETLSRQTQSSVKELEEKRQLID